jgi:hypothetical protein
MLTHHALKKFNRHSGLTKTPQTKRPLKSGLFVRNYSSLDLLDLLNFRHEMAQKVLDAVLECRC